MDRRPLCLLVLKCHLTTRRHRGLRSVNVYLTRIALTHYLILLCFYCGYVLKFKKLTNRQGKNYPVFLLSKIKKRCIFMLMYKRLLFKNELPKTSCFLFGPRQTGKTTLLNKIQTKIRYDLLKNSEFLRLNKDPDLVYKECSKLTPKENHIVWIDEVQKIPRLLDTVHRTIEKSNNINFILSGSSARKLKQQGVNLLGGRALDYKFHPMTSVELANEFDLELAIQFGTLPKIYKLIRDSQSELALELLSAYVTIYLEQEIKQEALVRDLQPFQRFLEVSAQCSGN